MGFYQISDLEFVNRRFRICLLDVKHPFRGVAIIVLPFTIYCDHSLKVNRDVGVSDCLYIVEILSKILSIRP